MERTAAGSAHRAKIHLSGGDREVTAGSGTRGHRRAAEPGRQRGCPGHRRARHRRIPPVGTKAIRPQAAQTTARATTSPASTQRTPSSRRATTSTWSRTAATEQRYRGGRPNSISTGWGSRLGEIRSGGPTTGTPALPAARSRHWVTACSHRDDGALLGIAVPDVPHGELWGAPCQAVAEVRELRAVVHHARRAVDRALLPVPVHQADRSDAPSGINLILAARRSVPPVRRGRARQQLSRATAVLLYGGTILASGSMLLLHWRYACMKDRAATCRRRWLQRSVREGDGKASRKPRCRRFRHADHAVFVRPIPYMRAREEPVGLIGSREPRPPRWMRKDLVWHDGGRRTHRGQRVNDVTGHDVAR